MGSSRSSRGSQWQVGHTNEGKLTLFRTLFHLNLHFHSTRRGACTMSSFLTRKSLLCFWGLSCKNSPNGDGGDCVDAMSVGVMHLVR
jgi:hypothetical protein